MFRVAGLVVPPSSVSPNLELLGRSPRRHTPAPISWSATATWPPGAAVSFRPPCSSIYLPMEDHEWSIHGVGDHEDDSTAHGDRHHRREIREPQARDPPLRGLRPRIVRRVVAGPRLSRCGARIIGTELARIVGLFDRYMDSISPYTVGPSRAIWADP